MKAKKNHNKGFTLVELLIVIFILAILTGGAVTAYSTITRQEVKTSMEQLEQSINVLKTSQFTKSGIWYLSIGKNTENKVAIDLYQEIDGNSSLISSETLKNSIKLLVDDSEIRSKNEIRIQFDKDTKQAMIYTNKILLDQEKIIFVLSNSSESREMKFMTETGYCIIEE